MGALLSRTVEICISNRTDNITLSNARTFFECGFCHVHPKSRLGPGSRDCLQFRGSFPFWGVAGILVYEAESFTLAIYFSNPIDYNKFSMELGLELSMSKAHRGSVADAYTRMAKGAYSSSFQDAKFSRIAVNESRGIVELSDGPVKVSAVMSYTAFSVLEVVLEEQWGTVRMGQD